MTDIAAALERVTQEAEQAKANGWHRETTEWPYEAEPAPSAEEDVPKADPDLDAFLAEPDPEYDWVVPGLLERGDRAILTGFEGKGKSTFLRQFAVQCGAGIHPFTLAAIDPIRVLLLDLENAKRHTRRQLRPLRIAAGHSLQMGQVRVRCMPEGIDLLDPIWAEWLEERVKADRPDLLITGPSYKLIGGDPTEERPAKAASKVLDHLRNAYGFALLLEAHVPYSSGGTAKRPERPYGASLWSRWPEFGLFLADDGRLLHWRGARDEREWPAQLKRGGAWPWTVREGGTTAPPHEMIAGQKLRAVLAGLLEECEGWMTSNEIFRSTTGFGRSKVLAELPMMEAEGLVVSAPGPRDSVMWTCVGNNLQGEGMF